MTTFPHKYKSVHSPTGTHTDTNTRACKVTSMHVPTQSHKDDLGHQASASAIMSPTRGSDPALQGPGPVSCPVQSLAKAGKGGATVV